MKPAMNENHGKAVVLHRGEGEKILFRIGLMTFKVSSSMTNNNFVICETELPPGAAVDEHSHTEAETFYILEGDFTFFLDTMEAVICTQGAFVHVPPNVRHGFKNSGAKSGKILGTMFPGGENGLESLFRRMGIKLDDTDEIPDLNNPVESLLDTMNKMRESKVRAGVNAIGK
jgi:quercetin dioxygenase-like cupin family protein